MSLDFTIAGDPATIIAKAGELRARASTFTVVSQSLTTITTGGWTGRAAERFRDRFEVEPVRWEYAASGFFGASNALVAYAQALQSAQSQAAAARQEHARGEAETVRGRTAYDQDVAQARQRKAEWEAANGEGTYTLTIEPFHDSGAPIRSAAVSSLASARAALETAEHECARLVRAACDHAPASRNWLETGLAFIGGVLLGAGEAVWELGSMLNHLQFGPLYDLIDLASGNLTPEELAAKNQLKIEQAQAMWNALKADPLGFGKEVGKAVLDWDTWADDPARALGHLVPDAIVAVATGGAATAATRGGRALQRTLMVLKDLSGYDLLEAGVRGAVRVGDDLTAYLDDLNAGRVVDSLVDRLDPRYLRPTPTDTRLLNDALAGNIDDIGAWLDRVNPRYADGADWQYNCGPCSRAFADTFQGVETRVAPGDIMRGESWEMHDWAGVTPTTLRAPDPAQLGQFTQDAYDKVAQAAASLPDGSTLVVGVDWPSRGGHWFNAVVDGGQLRWVDAQSGLIHDWPPSYGRDIAAIDVIQRRSGSDPWQELVLK
ncbi:MAG: hypothetical protein IPF90_03030 [Actinomycetales bacterium]|jgi:hypothetical protein|nr:hypothetical protein [Candidatus Phosphoribacter baldrii]